MLELWQEAIQHNKNRGFLIIFPYEQWGSGKRVQIGSLDGHFFA
jgi:hypothetical protein